jgi:prepilin-type N-terminal cleavage/methylation domain-containing protein
MKKINTRKGFTLIELLVVIAIIALLLSILMPSLTKVKEQAKFVIGGNNIRQCGLAEMMYTTENNGNFTNPMDVFNKCRFHMAAEGLSLFWTGANDWMCRWHDEEDSIANRPELAGLLWPYLENQDALMCPSYKSLAVSEGSMHQDHNPDIPMEVQYSFVQNGFLGDSDTPHTGMGQADILFDWLTPSIVAKKISHLRRTSDIYMFTEENFDAIKISNTAYYQYDYTWANVTLNDTALYPSLWGSAPTGSNPGDGVGSLHKTSRVTAKGIQAGVAHAVFADGHFDVVRPWESQSKGSPIIKASDYAHR